MKCVIVGNGASLTVDQLEMLDDIHSIACNRINLIYPLTHWRPAVYIHPESLAPDLPYIRENIALGIECWLGEHYARPPVGVMDLEDAPNIHWIKDCHHHLYNFDNPETLDEWHLPQLCSFGGSVNMAMQLAVIKGFDELILIGCDLQYRQNKHNHFDPAYEHGGEQPAFYQARNAFYGHVTALNWIRRRKKNIRVLNATPGGFLELWERVDLADALSDISGR
jgi:hypothetical protein